MYIVPNYYLNTGGVCINMGRVYINMGRVYKRKESVIRANVWHVIKALATLVKSAINAPPKRFLKG